MSPAPWACSHRVLRPRRLPQPAERLKDLPAALRVHRRQPVVGGHPAFDLRWRPQAIVQSGGVLMRSASAAKHAGVNRRAVRPFLRRRSPSAAGPSRFSGRSTARSSAGQKRAGWPPRWSIALTLSARSCEMPRFGQILGTAITLGQFIDRQMRDNLCHTCFSIASVYRTTPAQTAAESASSQLAGIRITPLLASSSSREWPFQAKRVDDLAQGASPADRMMTVRRRVLLRLLKLRLSG